MKILFASICLLVIVFGCSTSTQDPTISFDPKVQQYIKEQGSYIHLTDKQKAIAILEDNYDQLLNYMEENDLNKNNYFLLDGELSVSQDANYIMIPIRHYNSLKLEMEKGIDMKPIIKKQGVSKNGNPLGKDGYLILNIAVNKVERFQLWE